MTMRTQKGLTTLELLVTVAVSVITLGLAVPSFGNTLTRHKLEGAANELRTDLQWARSEAVRRGLNVSLITITATRYSVRFLDESSTTQTLKDVTLPAGLNITPSQQATFNSVRGTLDETVPATFEVSSSNTAAQINLVLNAMGRVQMCTPNGMLAAYKTCS
jgi:type IV fimbrial biogenesis protein FimT